MWIQIDTQVSVILEAKCLVSGLLDDGILEPAVSRNWQEDTLQVPYEGVVNFYCI